VFFFFRFLFLFLFPFFFLLLLLLLILLLLLYLLFFFCRGFNSGVSLIHVARLKESREFMGLLTSPDTVFKLMAAMRENDQEAANMREYSSAEFGTATVR